MATKRTYQPSKVKRAKKFGFLSRQSTSAGKKIVKNRRMKNRKRLTA